MRRVLLTVALVAVAHTTMAQPPPKSTATIRGRIVAADTGTPLRRARITASSPALGGPPRAVSTDLAGRYELKDLPPGRYSIRAARGGYLALSYGQRRPLEQATPLEILEGQTVERVDFMLPRTGRITGHIVDEVGDPIANAQMFAMRWQYFQGGRRLAPVASGHTDDSGAYKITGLAPGTYFVRANTRETWTVTREGRRDVMLFGATFFPGVPSVSNERGITVGIGERVSGIDFAMLPTRAVTIRGTAVSSRGTPVSSVALILETMGPGGGSVGLAGTTVVNGDGTFTIRDVAPGQYKLQAAGSDEMATHPIVVTETDIENVALVTSAGWSITGSVTTESGAPPAVARDRIRIAAPLLAGMNAMMMQGQPRGRSTINDDWTFQITAIVGAARLRVAVPEGWGVKSIQKDGRDIIDEPLEMKSGEQMTGVRIVLTDRLSTVSGGVVDARDAPVSAGTVVVFASDSRKWLEESRHVRAVRPDVNGQWRMNGLPAGDYLAVAIEYVQDGMWNDPEYLESIRRHAQKLTIDDAGSATVSLRLITEK